MFIFPLKLILVPLCLFFLGHFAIEIIVIFLNNEEFVELTRYGGITILEDTLFCQSESLTNGLIILKQYLIEHTRKLDRRLIHDLVLLSDAYNMFDTGIVEDTADILRMTRTN